MLFRVSLYEIKSRLRRNKCAETVILLHSLISKFGVHSTFSGRAGRSCSPAPSRCGDRASISVRKNSMTLDGMCPSIEIRTLF